MKNYVLLCENSFFYGVFLKLLALNNGAFFVHGQCRVKTGLLHFVVCPFTPHISLACLHLASPYINFLFFLLFILLLISFFKLNHSINSWLDSLFCTHRLNFSSWNISAVCLSYFWCLCFFCIKELTISCKSV